MTTTMVYFVPSPSSSSSLPPSSSPSSSSSSPSSSSFKVAGLSLLAEAAMFPFPPTSTSASSPPHVDAKYHDHDHDHDHYHHHHHLSHHYRSQQHPSTPPASSPLRQSPSRSPSPSSSSSSSYSSSSPPLSSKTLMDLPDPAATPASLVSLATTADSSLSSPSTLRQQISSMVSPIQTTTTTTTQGSSLASVPLPRNVFYFVDPAHVESQPLGVQSAQLQEFLQAVVKSEWGPRFQICRFPLFDDIISCVLWGGVYHVTGTDIVKYVSWRFRLEGMGIGEQKKFEEGIFSDLRNLKPGTDSVLEEPRSKFLEFLFKAGCVRTHKKQKVFFWNSVPFDRLFQEAVRREKRRDINPVLNSLLSLKSTRDSEDETPSQPRPTKKSRIMAPAPATPFATGISSPPPSMAKLLPNTSTSPTPSVLPSIRDLNQAIGSNSAFLPPLGLALSGLLNLKEAAVPHPYPKGN